MRRYSKPSVAWAMGGFRASPGGKIARLKSPSYFSPAPIDDPDYSIATSRIKKIADLISSTKLKLYDEEALKLYWSSQQILDEKIKLFSIYLVFEFFGPTVVKLELNNSLMRILENPKVITPDSNYLDSIVREVKKLDKNNDEYQIKMVFKVCVDCRILKEYLPAFLKKTISEKTNWIEFAGRIGSALYNTRNSIVHAKSNYQGNNKINICPEDQLSQFNLFLKHASAQVIKWHKRLPGYQK